MGLDESSFRKRIVLSSPTVHSFSKHLTMKPMSSYSVNTNDKLPHFSGLCLVITDNTSLPALCAYGFFFSFFLSLHRMTEAKINAAIKQLAKLLAPSTAW